MMKITGIVFIVTIVANVQGQNIIKNSLKCYQCTVSSNDQCTDDHLKVCRDDQAYDRCMTHIQGSAKTGVSIMKKCALGPCTLRDSKASGGLGLDECDRSKPNFDCMFCCQGDGCNKDVASNVNSNFNYAFLSFFVYFIIQNRLT